MEHIRVHLMDLPHTVRAFTVMVDIDNYDIYINSRLNSESQHEAFNHEIHHINNKDFEHFYDVNLLEHIAHSCA